MEVQALFEQRLGIDTTEPERKLIRRLAELIGTRAARLSACGVAAICKKKGYESCHVGADGSVFNKYPHFPERQAAALRELFGNFFQLSLPIITFANIIINRRLGPRSEN